MSNVSARSTTVEAGYSLYHFIARSGEEGASCVEDLERAGQEELIRLNSKALLCLRQRKLSEGLTLILGIESHIASLPSHSPPFLPPLLRGCWYHAALAYYYYCMDAFDDADHELDAAHDCVVTAFRERLCLLPLVEHLLDFRMQHGRVACRRGRWSEMRRHLEVLLKMTRSHHPLCVVKKGTPVFLSSLAHYYASLTLNPAERSFTERHILDFPQRLRNLEAAIISLCSKPGLTIPYF